MRTFQLIAFLLALGAGSAHAAVFQVPSGGAGGGAATNAVAKVQTNGVDVISSGATIMNFIGATGAVSGTTAIVGFPNAQGLGGVTNSGIIYVDGTSGNDTTAQVDRMDKPFQTIDAASVILRSADNRAMVIFPGTYSVTNPVIMTNGSAVIGIGAVQLASYVSTVTNGPLFKLGNNSLLDNITAIAAKSNVANYGQSFAGVYANATASKNDAFTNAFVRNTRWIGDYDGLILVHSNLLTATFNNYYGDTKGDGILMGQASGDASSSNSVLIIKNSWLQITNASQNSAGYNPVGISIPYGKVIFDNSTLLVRSPIGTTNKAVYVDGSSFQDGRGQFEVVNSSIRSYSSNGVENGMQLFNGADTSLYNVTNVIVRGISDLNLSQTYGAIAFGRSVIGVSDLVIPSSRNLIIQSEGDNVGVSRTNLVYTDRSKLELIVSNLTFRTTGGTIAAGITNSLLLNQVGPATFQDNVTLSTISPSKLLRTDGSSVIGETTIGSGLSFDGTTLSATGGAGSSNYTTLASGSITSGSLTVTNTATLQGPLVQSVGQAPGTSTIVVDGSLNTRTSVLTGNISLIFSNMTAGQRLTWWGFSSNGAWSVSVPQSHSSNTVDRSIQQPRSDTWCWVEAWVPSTGQTNFDSKAQGYILAARNWVRLVTNEVTGVITAEEDKAVTNLLYASAMVIDCNNYVHASATNAIGGNVTLLLTNTVIGSSGSLSLLSDGSARTISLYAGPTITWISTNATSSATNLLTTASKRSYLNWDVRAGATASPSTNIYVWAINEP